jgi:hypothetical protein
MRLFHSGIIYDTRSIMTPTNVIVIFVYLGLIRAQARTKGYEGALYKVEKEPLCRQ